MPISLATDNSGRGEASIIGPVNKRGCSSQLRRVAYVSQPYCYTYSAASSDFRFWLALPFLRTGARNFPV